MDTPKPIPAPHELLAKAKGLVSPKKFDLSEYFEVMHELRSKELSYAEIAAWMTENLGVDVQRGQVYRVYNNWLEFLEHQKQEDEENARLAAEHESEIEPPDEESLEPPDEAAGELKFGSIEEAREFAENFDENMAEREDKQLKRRKS